MSDQLCKADIVLLEKAFAAEVQNAITGALPIIQSKTKRADRLAQNGYLYKTEIIFRGLRVSGYALTHLGRYTYGETCHE